MTRWILHVDLDQFLAAVEVRRRPELRGRPVVVGGSDDPTRARTVVTCASYEARAAGVHAGMPLRAAVRRCPEATFLQTDHAACEEASAQVMNVLRGMSPEVQVLGWDEAFLAADAADPEAFAGGVRLRVRAATALECSVGVGDTTQRAKLATAFAKPAGVFRLDAGNWTELMADRPTTALWGIGTRTAATLAAHGWHTVAELAAADPDVLAARFGPATGPRLGALARGGEDSTLDTAPREPRSRGRQTTFPADLTDPAEIAARLTELARTLTGEVVADGHDITRVLVTVRTASFHTRTRARALPAPTRDAADVERAALTVLDRFTITRPVRLLGVRLELAPPP